MRLNYISQNFQKLVEAGITDLSEKWVTGHLKCQLLSYDWLKMQEHNWYWNCWHWFDPDRNQCCNSDYMSVCSVAASLSLILFVLLK